MTDEEGKETPNESEPGQPQPIMRVGDRTYKFGKPKLKHRETVMKILTKISEAPGDLRGIAMVVQRRELTPEQAAEMDETDYEPEERLVMSNYKGLKKILDRRIASDEYPDWKTGKDVFDVCAIPNDQLTDQELNWKNGQWESFGIMNDILADVLLVTIRGISGHQEVTPEIIEELDYTEALQLFRNGLKYVKQAAFDIQAVRSGQSPERKN